MAQILGEIDSVEIQARSLSEIDFVKCRINNLQTFIGHKIPVSY